MIDRILDLFKLNPDPAQSEDIEPSMAAAALMFEVVWADHDIDEQETREVVKLIESLFDIDQARAHKLLDQCRTLHEDSVGVQSYTRILNEQLSQNAKVDVVRALWSIAYADAQLHHYEEHIIRKIADLLYLSHSDFIQAKLTARKQVLGE